MCRPSAWPASDPDPGTTLRTPSGSPASDASSAIRSADSRRQPGGLDDQAVAGREGRGRLPGRHQQGEVPGDHRPNHADRLADDQAKGVRTGRRDGVEDLVDRLREPAVGPDGIRDVDLAGVGDRLAAFERVEQRQFLEVRLEQVGEAEEDLLALGRGASRPAPVVECPPRGPATAASMSAAPPDAIVAIGRPVAGFSVTNVSPDAASWNCPSMNAFVRKVGSAATAIESSPAAGSPRSAEYRAAPRRREGAANGRRRSRCTAAEVQSMMTRSAGDGFADLGTATST